MYRYNINIYVLFGLFSFICGNVYEIWTPPRGPHKTLWCDITVCPSADDQCCSCNYLSDREYRMETLYSLDIEYIDVKGNAEIITDYSYQTSANVSLTHSYGRLRFLPTNLCNFENIIYIYLRRNQIMSIGDISCLKNLEILDLHGNEITYVLNSTFIGLTNLMKVDLSYNKITHIEPNTFSDSSVGVLYQNFRGNELKSLDITNLMIESTYCYIDFTESIQSGDFTNILNVQLDPDKVYGSGNVSFTNTTIAPLPHSAFINTNCQIRNDIFKLFPTGSWEYSGTRITCDCELEPVLENGYKFMKRMYYKSIEDDYYCEEPPSLRGDHLYAYVNDTELLDRMICDVRDGCPLNCVCTDQPSRDRLIVNCTNQNYKSLPLYMPESCNDLELYFSGNSIKELKTRNYFGRVTVLDLADNGVQTIHTDVPKQLTIARKVKLAQHSLVNLPKTITTRHPDILELGNKGIECGCDDLWMGEWRRLKFANRSNPLYCVTTGGIVMSEDLVADHLDCNDDLSLASKLAIAIPIIIAIILFSLISSICYKHELLILTRRFRNRKTKESVFKHDIFVSFSEAEDDVRNYVLKDLYPKLRDSGYTLFIPTLHLCFGGNREEDTLEAITESKTSVVILSESFYSEDSNWARFEFNKIYNLYVRSRTRNMIVINFGTFSKSSSSAALRAFFRLRRVLKLSSRRTKIHDEILKVAGKLLYPVTKRGERTARINSAYLTRQKLLYSDRLSLPGDFDTMVGDGYKNRQTNTGGVKNKEVVFDGVI